MKLAHLVALCSAVGFAAGESWEERGVENVGTQEAIIQSNVYQPGTTTTETHYVGYGRAAIADIASINTQLVDLNPLIADGCVGANLKLEMVYYARDHMGIQNKKCMTTTGNCFVANSCEHVASDRSQMHCVSVATVDGHGYSNEVPARTIFDETYPANDLDSVAFNANWKAHGKMKYEWFLKTTVTVPAQCRATVSVTAAKIQQYNPDQYFCVGRNDDMFQKAGGDPIDYHNIRPDNEHMYPYTNKSYDSINYFAESANLPYHPGVMHFAEDLVVRGPEAGNAGQERSYFNLGASPQLEFSCLNVYLTTLGKQAAGCEAVRTGFGTSAGAANDWAFNLLEVEDCGIAPYPESACCAKKMADCMTDNKCWFNANEKQCYPVPSQRIPLKMGASVLGDSLASTDGLVHSFVANDVNGPKSSWVSDDDVIARGLDGYNRRRWFFEMQVNRAPAVSVVGRCEWQASVSFASHTTGGICEPTTRLRCDRQAQLCFGNDWPFTAWPRYWRSYETSDKVFAENDESKYRTCNCLKQKEVCYRQGGCFAAKEYELIFQNCNEEECGNWCNSAGMAQYSLVAAALAMLAMVL